MRQFYKTLQEEEYIQKNPLNNINSLKKEKKLPNALSEDLITLVLETTRENFTKLKSE